MFVGFIGFFRNFCSHLLLNCPTGEMKILKSIKKIFKKGKSKNKGKDRDKNEDINNYAVVGIDQKPKRPFWKKGLMGAGVTTALASVSAFLSSAIQTVPFAISNMFMSREVKQNAYYMTSNTTLTIILPIIIMFAFVLIVIGSVGYWYYKTRIKKTNKSSNRKKLKKNKKSKSKAKSNSGISSTSTEK